MSLQLRFLQTMLEISSERSSTIILPLPIDLFRPFLEATRRGRRDDDLTPDLRRDPISGRTVAIAPARARRPGVEARPPSRSRPRPSWTQCPFCEGREDRTPPETFAVAPAGREPDTPGLAGPASSRTSIPRSSARRSSCTRRATRARWPSWTKSEVEGRSPWPVTAPANGAGRRVPHTSSARSTRAAPQARAFRTATRSSSRSASCCRSARGTCPARAGPVRRLRRSPRTRASRSRFRETLVAARRAGRPRSRRAADRTEPALGRAGRRGSRSTRPSSFGLDPARYATSRARSRSTPGCTPAATASRGRARLTVFAGLELGAEIYVNTLPPEEAARA